MQRPELPPTLTDSTASMHGASQGAAAPDPAPSHPGGAPAASRTAQAARGGAGAGAGGAVSNPPLQGVHGIAELLGSCDNDSVRARCTGPVSGAVLRAGLLVLYALCSAHAMQMRRCSAPFHTWIASLAVSILDASFKQEHAVIGCRGGTFTSVFFVVTAMRSANGS